MTSKRKYLQELDKLEKPIRDEFLEYVRKSVGAASIAEVEARLLRGDIDGILSALGINESALFDTTEAIRNAYITGGKFEAPAARITFNARSPEAERWIRTRSSQFVTRIANSQRVAIQETLESGLRLGRGPRQTALDIVGRVGATGRRSGGIVGLTEGLSNTVARTREGLLSGGAGEMRNYLGLKRRDRRFDGIVTKAISEGRGLSVAETDRITGRLADRYLQLRGEAIARTESIAALNAGRDQSWTQAIEEGLVDVDLTTKTWVSAGDGRTREDHAEMNGQVKGINEPFIAPDGSRLMRPGDGSLGASAAMVINCRCFMRVKADFISMAARRSRW